MAFPTTNRFVLFFLLCFVLHWTWEEIFQGTIYDLVICREVADRVVEETLHTDLAVGV